MKYCQTCGKPAEDNNIICPDPQCRGHLGPSPAERTVLSKHEIHTITNHVWKRIWKKHILFIFGEFSLLMLIGLIGLYDIYHKASNEVKSVIVTNVVNEFKTDRIRATVSEVASNQANETITTQIRPEVDKFEKNVGEELGQITDLTTNAVSTVKRLEGQSEFLSVLLKAINDDRVAFDQLRKWASDVNYPFHDLANSAIGNYEESDAMQLPTVTKADPWLSNIVKSNLTFQSYKDAYKFYNEAPERGPEMLPTYRMRIKLLSELWDRKDFSKGDKLTFLMDVYEHDRSLKVVSYAGRIVNQEPGCDYFPLSTTLIIKWWEQNKQNYQMIKTNGTSANTITR